MTRRPGAQRKRNCLLIVAALLKNERVAKLLLSFCKPKSREFERAFINEKRGNILSVVAGALLLERATICKSCYELQDY